ncbi:hypothetical protein AX17_006701 [Amanita inopinata Kibby_2008]|nr:hypothetical protein AX17_006701 [Amanita inopinata Kibby_2008]
MDSSTRENIVVVGGGGAGTSVARQLSETLDRSKYNLILISVRNYMVHYPAITRALVCDEGFMEDRAFIPLEQIFANGNGKLIVGKVVSITDEGTSGGHVTLEDGAEVKWSILVVAPGSIWEGPVAFPEPKDQCLNHVYEWRQKFRQARNIVLAGGGAFGTELAGELKDRYPDKTITIVHNQELPMNDYYPTKWRKDIARRLRKNSIRLIFNDRLDNLEVEHSTVKTRNGEMMIADLVIPCRGGKVNTDFIESLGENVLWASSRCVRIDPAFRLLLHKRIFAAGDVIEWEEQKQLSKALAHADMIAKNVMSTLKGVDPTAIYKGSREIISLSIGKSRGATYFSHLWGLQFGNRFTTSLKSMHLVVEDARERCNIKT